MFSIENFKYYFKSCRVILSPLKQALSVLILVEKKHTEAFRESILENRRENFKLNALFVVVLVLESKALYLQGMRCILYDIIIVRPHNYE